MPVTNGDVKVSEPWSLKSRNRGQRVEPSTAGPSNSQKSRNKSSASKTAPKEGATVDVMSRNKSVSSDKPWTTDGVNLSQKAEPKRRNRESGGKTMDTFSQNPNTNMSRNAETPAKTMESLQAKIPSGSTSTRKYPAKGANARGGNAG